MGGQGLVNQCLMRVLVLYFFGGGLKCLPNIQVGVFNSSLQHWGLATKLSYDIVSPRQCLKPWGVSETTSMAQSGCCW